MRKFVLIILSFLICLGFGFQNVAYARPQPKNPKVEKKKMEIDNRIYQRLYVEKMISLDKKIIKKAEDLIDKTSHEEFKQGAQDIILIRNKEIEQLNIWRDNLTKEIESIRKQPIY